jgi:hypothetical protein
MRRMPLRAGVASNFPKILPLVFQPAAFFISTVVYAVNYGSLFKRRLKIMKSPFFGIELKKRISHIIENKEPA